MKTISIPFFALVALLVFTAADSKPAHWGYEGEIGPEHWGDLDPAYELCKTGKAQSPIDIRETEGKDGSPLEFHYGSSKLNVENTGHTFDVFADPGNYVVYQGKQFDVVQFHFHHGSEHTIAGKRFAMEMHIVHKSKDGELLVVGTLLTPGKKNTFLDGFWEKLPAESHATLVDEKSTIKLADALPAKSGLYAYSGSLTTPPGTEGVNWFLFAEPREISKKQIKAYEKFFQNSFRPTQSLNGRSVTLWSR